MRHLVVLLALVAAPAGAAELTGFARDGFAAPPPPAAALATPHDQVVGFLGRSFAFEQASLADIAAAASLGTIERAGSLAWLCYDIPTAFIDMRVTFIADHAVAGVTDPLGIAVVEPANPTDDQNAGCAYLPEGLDLPSIGAPLPGVFLADIVASYGPGTPDAAGRLVYAREDAVGTAQGARRAQDVRFRVGDDMTDAVAVSQWSHG